MSFGAAVMATFGADTSGLTSGAGRVDSLSKKMTRSLGQIGIGLGFGAITGFFKTVIDNGSKISDLAEQLRIGSTEFQVISAAAKKAGLEQSSLERGIRNANLRTQEAIDGNKEYAESYARLGLDLKTFTDLPVEKKLEAIGKAYAKAGKSQAAYADVATVLGDRAGPKMLEVLRRLADEGYAHLAAEATRTGQVIDKQTIKQLDEAADRMALVGNAALVGGSQIFSFFYKITSGLGALAAAFVNTTEGIKTWGPRQEAIAKAAERAAAATKEQGTAVSKIMADSHQLATLAEADQKRALALLPVKDRIVALETQALQLRQEAIAAGKGTVEWVEKEGRARSLFAQVAKLRADQAKKDLAAIVAAEKEHNDLLAKKGDLEFAAMTTAEQAAALATRQNDLQRDINSAVGTGRDTLAKQVELLQVQEDLATRLLRLTQERADAEAKVAEAAKVSIKLADLNRKAAVNGIAGLVRGKYSPEQIRDATGPALAAAVAATKREIFDLLSRPADYVFAGGGPRLINQTRLENQVRALTAELSNRQSFNTSIDRYGVAGARSRFAGDPLVFDRFMRDYAADRPKVDETNRQLEKINHTLTDGITVQPIGPR